MPVAGPETAPVHRPPVLGLDGASLVASSAGAVAFGTLGGGPFGLPTTIDAGTILALLACVPACRGARLSGAVRLALVVAAATWSSPDGRTALVALTALAVLALSRPSLGVPRPVGLLWAALSGHCLLAPLLFRFVGRWVVVAEMPLIALVARARDPHARITGARIDLGGDWYVYVLEGCSAFSGLSTTAIAWYAAARLLGVPLDRRAFAGLLAASAGTVLANGFRISAMLPSPAAYAYWHLGAGGALVASSGVVLGVLPPLFLAGRR